MVGVSEHAWNEAQDQLGTQVATAALILVINKHSADEVASPACHLREMIDKAGAKGLHIERSFYDRLNGYVA